MNEMEKYHTVRGYELMRHEDKPITSAMEDYLEMMFRTSLEERLIRANNLSELLNVHPSSVTKMLQKLSYLGYVDYQKYGNIFLTEKGKTLGSFLYRRHQIITMFLTNIGTRDNILAETELIEHHISPETLTNLERFNQFIARNPDILKQFQRFRQDMSP